MKRISFLIAVILLTGCYRTNYEMQYKAKKELITDIHRHEFEMLSGPFIVKKDEASTTFMWYKTLEFTDTAKAYVIVPRKRSFFSNIKIGMNYQYGYLEGAMNSFKDLFPENIADKFDENIQLSEFKPDSLTYSIKYIIDINKLLFFIKEGYFDILSKNESYAVITFYEPFAEISQSINSISGSTWAAKIFFGDSNKISILPIEDPRK